jgi:hypothetical protein
MPKRQELSTKLLRDFINSRLPRTIRADLKDEVYARHTPQEQLEEVFVKLVEQAGEIEQAGESSLNQQKKG